MTASVNLAPLQRHLNEIQDDMSQISRDVDHVGHLVMEVTGDVRTTQEELAELRRQFTAYVEQAERTAAVQRAETKLGTLKADLEREYGHYKVVRRSSVGLLQAFDAGIVSEDVASQISEELMIQTPRYWLAPALVALAAWSRDDKAISTRAVTEAYNRSQAKTALFFALVLRREQRNPESVRWLRHYFASCDPRSSLSSWRPPRRGSSGRTAPTSCAPNSAHGRRNCATTPIWSGRRSTSGTRSWLSLVRRWTPVRAPPSNG